MKWTVIFWRSSGQWICAMPMKTRAEAEKHADRYLRDNAIYNNKTGQLLTKNTNEHIKDITFIEVELPE